MQSDTIAQTNVFRIEGRVHVEARDEVPGDMKLVAYAFDRSGRLLGKEDVDVEGGFDVPVKLAKPADVELIIGPDDDPQMVRQSSAYIQMLDAKEWSEGKLRVKPDIYLSREIWWPWRPVRVCIRATSARCTPQRMGKSTPVRYPTSKSKSLTWIAKAAGDPSFTSGWTSLWIVASSVSPT